MFFSLCWDHVSYPYWLCHNTSEISKPVPCQISILYMMLRKSYPFHTWENVMCVLHFLLVTNYDSGFIEVSLRRSPRIKQLSFGRTNSGSFYSVSQPKSRSIQRVHSFQQVKSGNILSSLSSGVHTNLVGGILGKRSMKSDIFLLDTGGSRLDINI